MKIKKYTDIDALFATNPVTGDVVVRKDDRAIKFAVKALVLTNIYERPFHKEISSPVRGLLFDNFSNSFEIVMREAISQLLANYEPRVDVIRVDVNPSYDNNKAYIKIVFMIKDTYQQEEVGITLERTR